MKEKMGQTKSNEVTVVYNLEEVNNCWKDIAVDLAKEKQTSAVSFYETKIILDEFKIILQVPLAIFDFVKNRRLKLIAIFKDKFSNEEINVVIEEKPILVEETQVVASTREIFEEMVKKNPLLQTLKDKLRLDFDL